jgi:hypothetical protein
VVAVSSLSLFQGGHSFLLRVHFYILKWCSIKYSSDVDLIQTTFIIRESLIIVSRWDGRVVYMWWVGVFDVLAHDKVGEQ